MQSKRRYRVLLKLLFGWILLFVIFVALIKDDSQGHRYKTDCSKPSEQQSRDTISSLPVPNVLHYIWTDPNIPFDFVSYMCILSAAKLQKPSKILFHSKKPLRGYWWSGLRKQTPLKVLKLVDPVHIFNNTVYDLHQRKHLVELLKLYHYGGIYMNTDVMVLRSLDPLRSYPAVVGTHAHDKVLGHIIMSSQRSDFIEIWLTSYRDDFHPHDRTYNTETMPLKLASRFPNSVRKEHEKLASTLDDRGPPWQQAYIASLASRSRDIDYTPETLMSMNSTAAAVIRHAMSLINSDLKLR